MEDAIEKRLKVCFALWNSAERAIKEAEFLGVKAVMPSINELRYAGRWLVLALDAITDGRTQIDKLTTVDDALSYAALCCMQAKHDAVDHIVILVHKRIESISEKYSQRIVKMYMNDYDEIFVSITDIDTLILSSREERQNRGELYDNIIKDHLPKVTGFLKRLRAAETTMAEELEAEAQRLETERAHHEELVNNLRGEARSNKIGTYVSLAFNVLFLIVIVWDHWPAATMPPPKPAHAVASTPSTDAKPVGAKPH
jgi:hypothetical protein